MTEQDIKLKVERMIDRLDRRFMSDANTMTQVEYDAEVRKIYAWAEEQYSTNTKLAGA
jgi:hypothetical protein